MRGKVRSVSLASTFLILAVMTFSSLYVQGFQATQPPTQSPLLIPPVPSAPYWTYTAGGVVYAVSVSADGRTIVAGGADDNIRVFGRQDNTTIWTYKTGGDVAGVTVSSNGTIIAAGSTDQHLRLFLRTSNVTVGDVISSGPIVREVAMSSDGATIAWGTTGSPKAYLLSLAASVSWSYTVPNDIGGLKTAGPAVGIAGDGSLAAYGCWDNKLYVFKYDTTAPALGSPSVSPSGPVGGQSINVSVSATDNWELSTVTLYYRNASSISWSSKAMSLEGVVYRATIGPYSAGVNVSYYINATDTSANFACSPANAPNSYYTIAIGQAGLSLITIALIGGVVAVVVIIAAVLLMRRGKRRRR